MSTQKIYYLFGILSKHEIIIFFPITQNFLYIYLDLFFAPNCQNFLNIDKISFEEILLKPLLILRLLNHRLNFIGDLLTKARELTGETYHFKKGYSRVKMSSDSEEKDMEPKEKRKKIMKAERLNEIENLSDVIKNTALHARRKLLRMPLAAIGVGKYTRWNFPVFFS
jgi:hypothetical protein